MFKISQSFLAFFLQKVLVTTGWKFARFVTSLLSTNVILWRFKYLEKKIEKQSSPQIIPEFCTVHHINIPYKCSFIKMFLSKKNRNWKSFQQQQQQLRQFHGLGFAANINMSVRSTDLLRIPLGAAWDCCTAFGPSLGPAPPAPRRGPWRSGPRSSPGGL